MAFLTNDKLTIVGAAGMIGSNMAQTALMMGLTSEICLYDVFSPEGVAEEMRQSGFDDVNIVATTNAEEAFRNAKYIISSGGAPRKAGMTREDLLAGNCNEESYVATRYAIGLDGLLYFYEKHNEVNQIAMRDAFIEQMDYPKDLPMPYAVEGSKELFDRLAQGYYQGVTATAPGFYGPQGRTLRMHLTYPENNRKIEAFNYQGWRVCNFEMESSALYGLGKMMGHNCLTICTVIANRVTEKFAVDYHPYVKKLVLNTLERLSAK